MSSSYHLAQRYNEANKWNKFSKVLGDTYIRPFGECHPDFIAHPIGPYKNPKDAIKMCVRKPEVQKKPDINFPATREKTIEMYSTLNCENPGGDGASHIRVPEWSRRGTQGASRYITSSNGCSRRSIQDQQNLLDRDYLRWEVAYNGIGVDNNIKNSRISNNLYYRN